MNGCLWARDHKLPIIVLYFESETVLIVFNLEARYLVNVLLVIFPFFFEMFKAHIKSTLSTVHIKSTYQKHISKAHIKGTFLALKFFNISFINGDLFNLFL